MTDRNEFAKAGGVKAYQARSGDNVHPLSSEVMRAIERGFSPITQESQTEIVKTKDVIDALYLAIAKDNNVER